MAFEDKGVFDMNREGFIHLTLHFTLLQTFCLQTHEMRDETSCGKLTVTIHRYFEYTVYML